MKEKILILSALVFMALGFVGCSFQLTKAKSITFQLEDGTKVKSKVSSKEGYSISGSETPYSITKDGNKIADGRFAEGKLWDEIVKMVENEQYIDEVKNEDDRLLYKDQNGEMVGVYKVKDSNWLGVFHGKMSVEDAVGLFESFEFTAEGK